MKTVIVFLVLFYIHDRGTINESAYYESFPGRDS